MPNKTRLRCVGKIPRFFDWRLLVLHMAVAVHVFTVQCKYSRYEGQFVQIRACRFVLNKHLDAIAPHVSRCLRIRSALGVQMPLCPLHSGIGSLRCYF